jgi:hypothetical protein
MRLENLPKHHAVLVVSQNRLTLQSSLWHELEKGSLSNRLFAPTVLDINTAREIIAWANTPHTGDKVAIISFHTASIPAQNAMLKILEEPPEGVRFVVITSNREHLLDTVLSRLHILSNQPLILSLQYAEEFLKTSPTKRMKLPFVEELLSRVDEEDRKDREAVRGFILSLSQVVSTKKPVQYKELEELLECASYAGDSSSSGKAIIEYVSLRLPG